MNGCHLELEDVLGRVSALQQFEIGTGIETLSYCFEIDFVTLKEALGESSCELWSWPLGSKNAWN